MIKWKEAELGEYCDFQEGYVNPSKEHPEYFGGSVKWCRAVDINDGYIYHTSQTLTEEGFKSAKKSALLFEPNTIVISKSGTIGRVGIIKDYMCGNRATINIKPKNNADVEFIFYMLKSKQREFADLAVGSVQKNLYVSILEKIKFKFPSLDNQKKISSYISTIDKKIEINNQINRNLSEQAQAVFKEWFVDNPESAKWKQGTFSDLVISTLGGDWGKEDKEGNYTEQVYCVRGADIPEVKEGNKGKMPTRFILPKNYAAKQLVAGDIVVEISGGSPTQSTGRVASISQSLLDRYDKGMVCTNFCRAIKPKDGYSMFIYYYWQYLYERGIFFLYENGTTGIKNLDIKGFLENEEIIIPPKDLVDKFDALCQTIFNEIFKNGISTEKLAETRDTLLPRLMSGKLDVSELEL